MKTPLHTANTHQTRNALWAAVRSRPREVAIVITLSILTTVGGLALPAILGIYTDLFTKGNATKTNITQLTVAAIIVTFLAAAISYAADRQTRRWGTKLAEDLRNDAANAALSLDMKTLENTPPRRPDRTHRQRHHHSIHRISRISPHRPHRRSPNRHLHPRLCHRSTTTGTRPHPPHLPRNPRHALVRQTSIRSLRSPNPRRRRNRGPHRRNSPRRTHR